MTIHDNFIKRIHPRWQIGEIGDGRVYHFDEAAHLVIPTMRDDAYADAQLTDYITKTRDFHYRPPLRMTVTAHATAGVGLRGTAGFGFWNHPFVPGERGFRVPQALWFFFSSPPNNMPLALDVPGIGWKAATFNAQRWQFYALLPAAPIGVLLMRIPRFYRQLWPIGQRAIGVSETLLDSGLLYESHTYRLEWLPNEATFSVDGKVVHRARHAIPRDPLGFIAWIDNQYAVVTPRGNIGFGFVNVPERQSLVLEAIHIEPL